ncbi:MAG: UL2 protein [Phormidesmis priestleyi Ana]|uniref:UL2 protein n=1 Tax=Phormidesmis priestleyi Ana TaxID=1666911 RepID=A0A0P8BUY6_9CYAN|nr:MAG: UL2 protein [Phormidesmis priestleyi Ana]
MALNFEFLFWFLTAMVGLLWVGYLIARVTLGPQAAGRNLFYSGPWLVLGAAIAIFLSLMGRYGLTILYGLYAVGVVLWLVSWPLRKRRAGALKLEVGRTSQNKILLWVGLAFVGLAIAMTIPLLDLFTGALVTPVSIAIGAVKIAFWWAIALLFIMLGLSDLEIRENGLSYLYSWQPWDRVEAFGWDDDKPNTLILRVVKRSPFSRRYVTMGIPPAQKNAVDQLIDDYICEADLAAEMDGDGVATS